MGRFARLEVMLKYLHPRRREHNLKNIDVEIRATP